MLLPLILLIALLLPLQTSAFVTGSSNWAEQGFYFDWNNATAPLPTPITGQCETINVKWYRGAGTGPDPVAPFIFKLYTSIYTSSFVIDAGTGISTSLAIPFDSGTQYVLCMTDSLGISGGCQDLYTVYPTPNSTCQSSSNMSIPSTKLGVRMTSLETGGPLSRFGWPASCSDLQFDLLDGFNGGIVGTAPYTLTVAPAFRTPMNMIFESTIRWTVALDHGHPFFVSVSDANGITWTNGPLHAGAGSLNCFANPSKHSWLTLGASLGISFSFLVIGFLLATFIAWYSMHRRPVRFTDANGSNRSGNGSGRDNDDNNDPKKIQSRMKALVSRGLKSKGFQVSDGVGKGLVTGLLDALHLRRPPRIRTSSSNGGLVDDRPSLGRSDTSGTVDLAESPVEDRPTGASVPPFVHGASGAGKSSLRTKHTVGQNTVQMFTTCHLIVEYPNQL